jgi:hypothetical protein
MQANYIDARAFEHAVRKVSYAVKALQARDTAANNSDIRTFQTYRELQMVGDVAKPGFTCGNGPDATKRLILDVDTLHCQH